tara:strand:+ start:62705 stop:62806 length:102 start_codon:yes stop_codon:yes gene_type:complete
MIFNRMADSIFDIELVPYFKNCGIILTVQDKYE